MYDTQHTGISKLMKRHSAIWVSFTGDYKKKKIQDS